MTMPNMIAALGAPWAVRPDSVPGLKALLASTAEPKAGLFEESPLRGALARGVAILPVRGFLLPRADAWEEFCGCCSVERLGATLDALLADDGVTAVVLSFDSPGGSVLGIEELARKILGLRDAKPIVALVDPMAASAAYWLAAACTEVWMPPSAMAGAIGTISLRYDWSAANAEAGVTVNVISAGAFKSEGIPDLPMSEAERTATQAVCDDYYALFTATVAKGRGVTPAAVRGGFGQGRIVTAKDSLSEGMVDRIGTLSDVLAKYTGGKARGGVRAIVPTGASAALLAPAAGTPRRLAAQLRALLVAPMRAQAEDEPMDPEEMTQDPDETDEEFEARKAKARAAQEPDAGGDPAAPATGVVPSPAPVAKETAMQDNAAPSNGAPSESRMDAILALAATHERDLAWVQAKQKGGQTVEAIERELLGEYRAKAMNAPRVSPGDKPVVTGMVDNEAKRPFKSFGENVLAIVQAQMPGGRVDKRLYAINDAARVTAGPSGMSEGVGADGGFFIQSDLLPGVIDPVYQEDPILSRVTRIPIGSGKNGVRYNVVDETSRGNGSRWGGISMAWAGEADQGTASKPKLRRVEHDLKKIIGLAYLTDELSEDAPAAESLLTRAFQAELGFMLTDAIFRGTGAGQPLGWLNAGCKVTQAIEATQTIANSATFLGLNVSKMMSLVPSGLWGDIVFLYQQELLPYLVNATAGSSGVVPLFIGAGGLTNKPFDTILGRPAFPSEFCEAVGTPGDIIAVVPSQYHLADKGGANVATSVHVRFLFDEMALRITYRADGQPLWLKSVTPYKGANARSPFVVLNTRS